MPKNKQQKKKDRERRVAQKKIAEAQKRASQQSAGELQNAQRKPNKLASAIPAQKPEHITAPAKQIFARRRSMG